MWHFPGGHHIVHLGCVALDFQDTIQVLCPSEDSLQTQKASRKRSDEKRPRTGKRMLHRALYDRSPSIYRKLPLRRARATTQRAKHSLVAS